MNKGSTLRPIIDKLLREREGIGLDVLVARARGFGTGWLSISKRIYAMTGNVVDVDQSTLFRWYSESEQTPEKEAV